MILDKDAYEKAKTKHEVIMCCDFCGAYFKRKKNKIIRSHLITKIDSCGKKECTNKKRKTSNLERFGCDHPSQNKEVQQKTKETNNERFGCDNPMQNKEVQQKTKETNREKLGTDYPTQNEEVMKKISEAWAAKTPEEKEEIYRRVSEKLSEAWAAKTSEEKAEIHRKIIATTIQNHGRFPANNFGPAENSIRETLNSFGFDFKSNYTLLSGKQIDMYDENKKIGIEYCGLHWHHEFSPEPRLRDYHHNKCKILESKGIQLLTIFEDEWLTRQKQCLGHIKATLGICDKKLHGRKCIVKEVDKDVAQQFFDDYHIQGKNSLTIITFGLFYDNELVGVMSMGRHHRQGSDDKQVVLDRLCFKDGISVNGGSSKLLNACKIWAKDNGYQRIISFSDNRWSAGKVYKAMGFTMEQESGPDYSYVNVNHPKERISKQSQQKKHTGCPADKTEVEWAHINGLARIWDCGKRRWVMEIF